MCVGVTVLTLPPTVACLGYISWFQGCNFCDERLLHHELSTRSRKMLEGQPQTFTSISAGVATMMGTYWLISQSFPYLETSEARDKLKQHALEPSPSSTKNFQRITSQAQTGYRPPESVMEVVYKVTPPLTLRIGTTTMAFFCAGVVQTYVADALQG